MAYGFGGCYKRRCDNGATAMVGGLQDHGHQVSGHLTMVQRPVYNGNDDESMGYSRGLVFKGDDSSKFLDDNNL